MDELSLKSKEESEDSDDLATINFGSEIE